MAHGSLLVVQRIRSVSLGSPSVAHSPTTTTTIGDVHKVVHLDFENKSRE